MSFHGTRAVLISEGVGGPLRFENIVENVAGQHLRAAPGRMPAPGSCGDRGQRELLVHFHRTVKEEGKVVLGESEDAPMGLAKVTDEAQVDGVEIIALADGPGVQVHGKRLARLRVFGQPVVGLRRRQGIGQRA
jgi:hypothetical protein